ncbi:hypothetical protein ACFO26_06965 [Lactococcus nasutitermitis]|uniref:Transcriptional regulator n=1 Tax=Lactococcus nasutitermitis TaxID=1652957 RepID=A0ABV9JDY8_9LACT|nr:hypothetical protein [Lactococcus nasutitermitis]
MGKSRQSDLFESTYGTEDITTKDWRIIRSMLRILLRQSANARRSKEVQVALNEITREADRDVFIKYFLKGQSIIKISLEEYYDESVVRRYLRRATKEFTAVYCDGLLAKPFQ